MYYLPLFSLGLTPLRDRLTLTTTGYFCLEWFEKDYFVFDVYPIFFTYLEKKFWIVPDIKSQLFTSVFPFIFLSI